MKIGHKVVAAVTFFVLAVAIVVFFQRNPEENSGTSSNAVEVRIATFSTAVDYAPFYIALEKGYFERELSPLNAVISVSKFEALAPLNDALSFNRLDIVFEAEPPALIAEAAGIDVYIAALSVSLTQNLIARTNENISSVSGLSGKRIGVLTGTSSHYGLLKRLSEADISLSDVEIINSPPAEARAAFRSAAIDAWAVWPPFPETEQIAGTAVEIPGSSATIHSLLVTRNEFALSNPELLAAVIRAVEAAQEFIRVNPQESKEIVSGAVNLPLEVIELAWSKHDFNPELSSDTVADLQSKADFLVDREFIDKKINVSTDLLQLELN